MSFFGGFFDRPINGSGQYLNSQNISLLQAALVINPKDAQGGGGISMVGGTALVAESGLGGVVGELEVPQNGQIAVYVVKEGDSLSQIAEMFGVSPNTIRWANDIGRNDTIRVGQVLVILPVSGVRYTAKEGDTLEKIASEFKGDLSEIALFNGLDPNDRLSAGSEIIIPRGEVAPPPVPTRSSGGGTRVASGGSQTDPGGYYIRPIRGGIRTQGLHGYNAVDLASYEGAEVYASASGRVIVNRPSGWNGGYGNYIVIEHDNGTQTLYSHLSRNLISQGQWVEQGQVIGLLGNTGLSTGPHLHFEIRGGPTNPF